MKFVDSLATPLFHKRSWRKRKKMKDKRGKGKK